MAANDCISKSALRANAPASSLAEAGIPRYLVESYWWAYLHPAAIAFFDHPWVVNLILWGNFDRLRRIAFDALGTAPLAGRTLQIACVYGDLTSELAKRLDAAATLDVVDVVPAQLANLREKIAHDPRIALCLANSTALGFGDARYERALIFFLLHEQPEAVRRATLSEAVRVVKPGGQVVIIDYHLPGRLNPLRYLMRPLLRWLEPFALDLWHQELNAWLPAQGACVEQRRLFFGGLYQATVLRVGV